MTENEYAYELRLLAERFPPLEYHLVDVDGGPSAVIAAYEKGFIDKDGLLKIAQKFSKSDYGQYIKNIYFG